jgi:hypothetical protein
MAEINLLTSHVQSSVPPCGLPDGEGFAALSYAPASPSANPIRLQINPSVF